MERIQRLESTEDQLTNHVDFSAVLASYVQNDIHQQDHHEVTEKLLLHLMVMDPLPLAFHFLLLFAFMLKIEQNSILQKDVLGKLPNSSLPTLRTAFYLFLSPFA